jgi:hypothetical protein
MIIVDSPEWTWEDLARGEAIAAVAGPHIEKSQRIAIDHHGVAWIDAANPIGRPAGMANDRPDVRCANRDIERRNSADALANPPPASAFDLLFQIDRHLAQSRRFEFLVTGITVVIALIGSAPAGVVIPWYLSARWRCSAGCIIQSGRVLSARVESAWAMVVARFMARQQTRIVANGGGR